MFDSKDFYRFLYNYTQNLDMTYDPGVLKVDTRLTIHSSVGSIIHELNYERLIHHTDISRTATIKEESPGSEERRLSDLDTGEILRRGCVDSVDRERDRDRENESVLVREGEEDTNSSLLSPVSNIEMDLGTDDSNSSSGSVARAPLVRTTRPSSGNNAISGYVTENSAVSNCIRTVPKNSAASKTVSEISEVSNTNRTLANSAAYSTNRTVCESSEVIESIVHSHNEGENPVISGSNDPQSSEVQLSSGDVDSTQVESCGYVYSSDMEANCLTNVRFTSHELAPQPSTSGESSVMPTVNRNHCSGYASNSFPLARSPGHTVATTTTVREREQQRQQQQQQQQHEGEYMQRSDSSLSLNIITDIEQAFPLSSSHFAQSDESLNLPGPQLMPTAPQILPATPNLSSAGLICSSDVHSSGSSSGYVGSQTTPINSQTMATVIANASCSTSDTAGVLTRETLPPYRVPLSPSHLTPHSQLSHPHTQSKVSNQPRSNDAATRRNSNCDISGVSSDYINIEDRVASLRESSGCHGDNMVPQTFTEGSVTGESGGSVCSDSSTVEDLGDLLPGYDAEGDSVARETEGERGFRNILFELNSPSSTSDYLT